MIQSLMAGSAISAAALGSGMLVAWLLLALGDLGARVQQMYRPRWRNVLQTFFADEPVYQSRPSGKAVSRALEALVFLPGLTGIIVAALMRDILLSPYLALLGIGLSWYLRLRRTRKVQSSLTAQTRDLVVLFRSRFAVGESPFSVLSEIQGDLPPGAVRDAVGQAVNTYQSSGSVDKALTPLRGMNNAHLARLGMILEASSTASTEAVVDEVKHIEDDLKARDRLAGQARASLALLKGTVRFLQSVNGAAILATVALPMWRDFFTSTLQRRGTFLAATLFVLLASMYFDQEIGMQEEKTL